MGNRRAPFVRGSATSEGASDFIEPFRETIALRVFNALKEKPRPCLQLYKDLGLSHQTCSPRFTELWKSGCTETFGLKDGTPASDVYRVREGATYEEYQAYMRRERAAKKSKVARGQCVTCGTPCSSCLSTSPNNPAQLKKTKKGRKRSANQLGLFKN